MHVHTRIEQSFPDRSQNTFAARCVQHISSLRWQCGSLCTSKPPRALQCRQILPVRARRRVAESCARFGHNCLWLHLYAHSSSPSLIAHSSRPAYMCNLSRNSYEDVTISNYAQTMFTHIRKHAWQSASLIRACVCWRASSHFVTLDAAVAGVVARATMTNAADGECRPPSCLPLPCIPHARLW